MADLDDFLLQEIFFRLPVKSLHRFKCVSNHWLSLISDTCFVHEYVQFQTSRTNDDQDDDLYKNLYRTSFIYARDDRTPSCLDFPSHAFYQYEGFSFEFIPRQPQKRGIKLLAASHGWILCSTVNPFSKVQDYYLCSPVFKQWIDIPRSPNPKDGDDHFSKCLSIGFMCEEGLIISNCSSNSNTRFGVKPLQFKVVKTWMNQGVLMVMVFSSETWKWRTSTITSKPKIYEFRFRICWNPCMVSCDRTLYWIERDRCVFALNLDADGNPLHWLSIAIPTESVFEVHGGVQLGLCHGQIRLSLWDQIYGGAYPKTIISIWKLIKEVHTGDHYQWSLKNRITIENLYFSFGHVTMVDCAPLSEDILHIVLSANHTVMFNLKNNTMVTKTQKIDIGSQRVHKIWNTVPFVLPYWPLPLKTPNSQPSKRRTGGIRINSMEPNRRN